MSEMNFALRAAEGAFSELDRAASGGARQLASDVIGLYKSMKMHPALTVRELLNGDPARLSSVMAPRDIRITDQPITGFDAKLNPMLGRAEQISDPIPVTPWGPRGTMLAQWQRDERQLGLSGSGISESGLANQMVKTDQELGLVRDRHGIYVLRATSALPSDMHVLVGGGDIDVTRLLNFNAASPIGGLSERLGHNVGVYAGSQIRVQFDPTPERTGFMRTIQMIRKGD